MICPVISSFNNKQELATHLFGKYKIRAELRSYIEGTMCQYCLMDFGTRYKLMNHVAHPSKKYPILFKCQHYYLNHVEKLDPEEVKQLDAEEALNTKSLKNKASLLVFVPSLLGGWWALWIGIRSGIPGSHHPTFENEKIECRLKSV